MTTDEPADGAATTTENAEAQWAFAIDPAWQPESDDEPTPVAAILGAWYVESDGTTGPFRANPDYVPSEADAPTDPVDAALHLLVKGEYEGDALLDVMRESLMAIALDDSGSAVVAPSPDDVPSVLVATSPVHARRVEVPAWQEITAKDLADSLPDEGVDVLLNPGAAASMRVLASSLKNAVADDEPLSIGESPFDRPATEGGEAEFGEAETGQAETGEAKTGEGA